MIEVERSRKEMGSNSEGNVEKQQEEKKIHAIRKIESRIEELELKKRKNSNQIYDFLFFSTFFNYVLHVYNL